MIRDLLRDVTPVQAVAYGLAAVAIVGCVWLVASLYIVALQ